MFGTTVVHAAPGVPEIISYQGRLTDDNGVLLGGTGTTYYFKFSIWDSPTVGGGTKLWPTSAPGATTLTVTDGVFDVNIGDTGAGYPDALTYDFQSNDTVYLQVEVSPTGSGYETLGPRPRITSASTAINAKTLSGLPSTYFLDATNLTNFDTRAIAAPLTGYTSGAGVITASDTILSAIQKLNGNIAGGGSVTSVFGRAGVVTAQAGDYTTDLVTEATNLYYTQARFDTAFGLKSTTNLAEGTNLYYTDGRFDTRLAAKSTDDLAEGTNLYYTDVRARAAISSAGDPIVYDNVTGVISINQADTSTDGYLSSADWNTFNNKGSGTVTSVSGTTDRITSTGGATPVIDIAATYAGQSSITTLGTITTGVWNGTAIANANLANSTLTIGSTNIALGATSTTLAGLSSVTSTTFVGDLTGTASGNEVPLTFSTGLTRTSNTITNNLSTGISGGQSVIGGTASGENLTLSSTSNATKGSILLGTSAYDEVNNRFGINTTPSSRLHITTNSIGATQADTTGIILQNSTAATAGLQQYSPASVFRSNAWLTTTLASHTLDYRIFAKPAGGTTAARGGFVIQQSLNGAAYTDTFEVGQTTTNASDYLMKLNGTNVFGLGGGVVQLYGSSSGFAFYNSSGTTQFAGLGANGRWALTPSSLTTAATINTWDLTQTWNNASGVYTAIKVNITNTASAATSNLMDLQVGGVNTFTVRRTGAVILNGSSNQIINSSNVGFTIGNNGITYAANASSAAVNLYSFGSNTNATATSGTLNVIRANIPFLPTSGTAVFNNFIVESTINQTGGASGITRGLYINPTLTAAADFRAIEVASTNMGTGAAGHVIIVGRNSNATPGAGSINLLSNAGTNGYVWQDAAGNLRIHTAAPTNANDTAGTVVGAQTSTRETKQDIEVYTMYRDALQKIVDAPLHTFRYIKEVEGYGEDSPLAKTRIGFIADEVDQAFMVGNVIDQVSVNGLVMAAIKEIDLNMQVLPVLEDRSLATKIADFLRGIAETSTALVDNLKSKKVQTQELCVGDESDEVCITKDQLRAMIEQSGFAPAPSTAGGSPEPIAEESTDSEPALETPTEEVPIEVPVEESLAPSEEAPVEQEPSEPAPQESVPEASPEPSPAE